MAGESLFSTRPFNSGQPISQKQSRAHLEAPRQFFSDLLADAAPAAEDVRNPALRRAVGEVFLFQPVLVHQET